MLPAYTPLPYKTTEELLAAAAAGAKFLFVRVKRNTAEPARLRTNQSVGGRPCVRAFDKYSTMGDRFQVDGKCEYSTCYLVLVEQTEADTKLDAITQSDKAGVAAFKPLPKAAPPVPTPTPVKPSAGLLTLANPDERRFDWGAKL